MSAGEYLKRKTAEPGQITNPSRYATGILHPNKRPVTAAELPLAATPKDSPETRGRTVLPESAEGEADA